MTDIVERLREWSGAQTNHPALLHEAADEIKRLRADKLHWEHQNGILEAEIERLRALRCSCEIADHISDECARLGKCKERGTPSALEEK